MAQFVEAFIENKIVLLNADYIIKVEKNENGKAYITMAEKPVHKDLSHKHYTTDNNYEVFIEALLQ